MRVSIGGPSHQVEVDCDHTDLRYVIDQALALWLATRCDETRLGAGTGFQIERADGSEEQETRGAPGQPSLETRT